MKIYTNRKILQDIFIIIKISRRDKITKKDKIRIY